MQPYNLYDNAGAHKGWGEQSKIGRVTVGNIYMIKAFT